GRAPQRHESVGREVDRAHIIGVQFKVGSGMAKSAPVGLAGFVDLTGSAGQSGVEECGLKIAGMHLGSPSEDVRGALEAAFEIPEVYAIEEVDLVQVRVQPQGGLEFVLGLLVLTAQREVEGARGVRLAHFRGELDGPGAGRAGLLEICGAVIEMLIQEEAGVGKPCGSGSETRIDGDRAQKHLAGEVVILLRLPIKKATASELIFVGLDLGSGHRLKAAS